MNRLLQLSKLVRLGVGIPLVSLSIIGCGMGSSMEGKMGDHMGGSSGSGDSGAGPPPQTVSVASVSGARQPMDGTWKRCIPSAQGFDEQEMVAVAGTSVSVTTTKFTSGSSCSLAPSFVSSVNTAGGNAGDKTATWWNGTEHKSPPNTTPPAGLSSSYITTMVYFGPIKAIILIDDTASPWVFWSGCGRGMCTVDGFGYPNYLDPSPGYAHIKQ